MRVSYTYTSSGYPVPYNVTSSTVLTTTETVLLTLDISNDPDSPYLTLEDDIHSMGLVVPVS